MRYTSWLRALLCVAFASMGSGAALAQKLNVDRIDIVTFGIFSPGKITQQEARPGTNGITLREGRKLLSQTETVPGVVGTTFGIQYVVRGAPKGQNVKLTYITRFPSSGMVNGKGEKLAKSQFDWDDTIGKTAIRTYTLDNPWEIVPGDWTMEFYYEGRKIGEKRFTVTAPKI
jgi:Domain of unknown function (DUF3859)